jgi:predicted PurR-regulated permease PerM
LGVEIPGMGDDLCRLGRELGLIWNAFLRGQVILFTLALVLTGIALGVLGTRYTLALALLAGLARFVPYIGPIVTWAVVALVAYFQGENYLGLPPWEYTLIVVGILVILNQIFDNLISPRVLGETLGIHPAAILVAAIIAANLMGLIGIVLAAPVLASVVLIGRYALRKMLDLDPWPEPELALEDSAYPWETGAQRFRDWTARWKRK